MRRLIALTPLALLLGCPSGDAVDPNAPTWHQDVAPLVAEHCQNCHAPGKIAPFDLVTYEDSKDIAGWLADTVEARTMPPWAAHDTDECETPLPWKDDARLTEEQIATFRAWATAGAPEGDPATATPLPAPRSVELDRVDKILPPLSSYTVPASGPDQFRCIVFDPETTENMWLTGLQVKPDNHNVVHHVLVFSSDADDAAAIDEAAAAGGGTFDCGAGNPAPYDAELIAAWAPGAMPMVTPEGTGMLVQGGSRIVAQVHYHPSGEVEPPDATSLELRWEEQTLGRRSFLALVGNESSGPELQPGEGDSGSEPEFVIPAGAKGHVETIVFDELDTDGLGTLAVFAVGTHMHWVGVDMKIDLLKANGDEVCLVHTPKWDFNWQRWYDYDASAGPLPLIEEGDGLRLRCTYDNSLDNPFVREALAEAGLEEPMDVVLGDETLDEMCLGVFGIYVQ
ncbi:MAG: hypothetical protein KDA24_05845 [Deltaproteobacteria bacterium]|nr:hypothetical protein [Deltaproteobacteria bacterium]